jgi:hypothetical protein
VVWGTLVEHCKLQNYTELNLTETTKFWRRERKKERQGQGQGLQFKTMTSTGTCVKDYHI